MAREIAAAGAPPPSAGDAFDVPDGVVYLNCAQPGAARFGQGESAQFLAGHRRVNGPDGSIVAP